MTRNILILLIHVVLTGYAYGQSKAISGYPDAKVNGQLEVEATFDSYLRPANLDLWMKRLAARPHHLGSPYGKESAVYIRDLFRSWGYEAEIETYKVLFPTPKVRLLELVSPKKFKASLSEPALKEDATSSQSKEQLPSYHAWSADGDITGELVFVNYGVPDDYDQLERMGIDVKGKIVIAKYGGSWRGIKPKVAQEHGAIGCLIYSDPREDGYFQGDVYPKGAFKSRDGVQRGSVIDLPVAPGDPITPGIGATENAPRIDRKEAVNLLKIPVQPISYADAQPLLAALGGPVAPPTWRGALPITYHVGPGPAVVHLKLEFNWDMVDCYNVIAKIKGSELPDEWVVRGNHHDAWVNGASDPVSGVIALMEEARAVSELIKSGWKPKRTLVYCAWDGEEPGLIGSTEWVEHHADELQQKVVAYINSDGNNRGFLNAGGSHTLETMVGEIAREVTDPQTGVSVLDRRLSRDAVNAPNAKKSKEIMQRNTFPLGALGSGSDYSPFIQHLGIPSLDISFGGEGDGGEYHSIYDSYDHFVRFKDPGFVYGIALAKVAGRVTLRLANAELLPFDFKGFYRTMNDYLTDVSKLLEDQRERREVNNQLVKEKHYTYAADPTEKYSPPQEKDNVPYLNFSNLQNALTNLQKEAEVYSSLAGNAANGLPVPSINRLNKILYQAEQKLTYAPGLPQRPWFRHTIYAPGLYTGYGVKTLPGIREAIEQNKWNEAQEQIEIVAKAIENYTQQVKSAAGILMLR